MLQRNSEILWFGPLGVFCLLCVCFFFSVLREFLCFVAQCFKVFFLCSGCITVFLPPCSFLQAETSLDWRKLALEKQEPLLYQFFKHCWKHLSDYLLLSSRQQENWPFKSQSSLKLLDPPLVFKAVSSFYGVGPVFLKTSFSVQDCKDRNRGFVWGVEQNVRKAYAAGRQRSGIRFEEKRLYGLSS